MADAKGQEESVIWSGCDRVTRRRVTAFRPEFAVHGKFGQPCPTHGTRIQRIVRAENEINYCPGCQADGRILKDRSLSRLLRDEWPETTDDLG